jgi:hypothetical protein
MKRLTAILILLVLMSITGYSLYFYRRAELEAGQVTLTFDRASSFLCMECSGEVFINGVKLGRVADGRTETFRFTPASDGNNRIFLRLVPMLGIGGNASSDVATFRATEGAVVYVRYEIISGAFTWPPNTTLEVAIEKEGRIPGRLGLTRAAKDTAGSGSSQSSEPLPWGAIGAVAGVLSALVGIIALLLSLKARDSLK